MISLLPALPPSAMILIFWGETPADHHHADLHIMYLAAGSYIKHLSPSEYEAPSLNFAKKLHSLSQVKPGQARARLTMFVVPIVSLTDGCIYRA